jgi:predicted transcriptional regulator
MSIHLTPAIEQKLNHLAAETLRSPDELAESAMEAFFADYDDLHREVKLADEEFERGEFLPHEEVVALFARRFAKA